MFDWPGFDMADAQANNHSSDRGCVCVQAFTPASWDFGKSCLGGWWSMVAVIVSWTDDMRNKIKGESFGVWLSGSDLCFLSSFYLSFRLLVRVISLSQSIAPGAWTLRSDAAARGSSIKLSLLNFADGSVRTVNSCFCSRPPTLSVVTLIIALAVIITIAIPIILNHRPLFWVFNLSILNNHSPVVSAGLHAESHYNRTQKNR